MRKRVRIAVAVFVVALMGAMVWRLVCPQEREPFYEGKALRVWLREYAGWDTSPEEWAKAKNRSEHAVRQIGTNAIPILLRLVQETESPRMLSLMEFWDQRIANRSHFPTWVRHPAWYKNQARYLNMEGEIGFKILGAETQQAVPKLISIYERTLSLDPLATMESRIAVSRSLVNIGPPAIPPLLKWASGTNEDKRLAAVHVLSQIRGEPSAVVPVLVKFLSHTNAEVRTEVAEALGKFGSDAKEAIPELLPLLLDPKPLVRRTTTNALNQIQL